MSNGLLWITFHSKKRALFSQDNEKKRCLYRNKPIVRSSETSQHAAVSSGLTANCSSRMFAYLRCVGCCSLAHDHGPDAH